MRLQDRVTHLIAICRENADSFRRAAEILLEEPELAHFFEEVADNRLLAADSLENKLLQMGERPNADILTAAPRSLKQGVFTGGGPRITELVKQTVAKVMNGDQPEDTPAAN